MITNTLFVTILVLALLQIPSAQSAVLHERDLVGVIEQAPTTSPIPTITPPSFPNLAPILPTSVSTYFTTVTITQTVFPTATPIPAPNLTFPEDSANMTAWQLISTSPDFKNFTGFLNSTAPDLVSLLNDTTQNVTVFTPPDSVFQPFLNDSFIANFSTTNSSVPFYHALLAYHIVNGTALYTSDFPTNDTMMEQTLLQPFNLTFYQTSNGSFMVNNASLLPPHDVNVTNGVIHPVNKILSPLYFINFNETLPGPFNLLQ